jgi:hypothetical protein
MPSERTKKCILHGSTSLTSRNAFLTEEHGKLTIRNSLGMWKGRDTGGKKDRRTWGNVQIGGCADCTPCGRVA